MNNVTEVEREFLRVIHTMSRKQLEELLARLELLEKEYNKP